MKTKLIFSFFLILTIAILVVFNSRLGQIPPAGKFLAPFNGIWQNALIPDIPKISTLQLEGLQEEVNIVINERGVPHNFANNDYDLYVAVGYVPHC